MKLQYFPNQDNIQNDGLTLQSFSSNPFNSLYEYEEWVEDNATEEIKEIMSDIYDLHFPGEGQRFIPGEPYNVVEELDSLGMQLKHSQLNYVRDSARLYLILTQKLYKARYSNFNHYCQQELGMTAWRAKQIIEAGAVTLKLINAGHTKLPKNCSQAYVMHQLGDEQLVDVWESVLDTYAMHEITAGRIEAIFKPPEASEVIKKDSIDVEHETYHRIVYEAIKLGTSVSNYINHALEIQKCKFSLLLNLIKYQV